LEGNEILHQFGIRVKDNFKALSFNAKNEQIEQVNCLNNCVQWLVAWKFTRKAMADRVIHSHHYSSIIWDNFK